MVLSHLKPCQWVHKIVYREPFMEPQVSLEHSLKPTTSPYPKPDETSPHLSTLFP